MATLEENDPQVARALLDAARGAKSDHDSILGFLKWFYGFLYALISFAAATFSLSLEIIFRYNFGERYLRIVPGLVTLLVVVLLNGVFGGGNDIIAGIWVALFVFCWAVHRLDILRRRFSGQVWHSWSDGVSYFVHWRWTSRQWVVDLALEPLLGGLLAAIAFAGESSFWPILALGGAGMFVKKWTQYEIARNKLLDTLDNQIESRFMSEALRKDSKPTQTAGFVVPGASRWTDEERATVARAYDQLDPKIAAALDPSPDVEVKPHFDSPEMKFTPSRSWAPTDASEWADPLASADSDADDKDFRTKRPPPPDWSDDPDELN